MAYTTTKMRDVFTPQEIREWSVRRATREVTGWNNGQRQAPHDVPIHSCWEFHPDPNTTVYRYHRTDIVRYDDKTLVINTGGWDTPTTRKHINEFLPHGRIYREKGQLYYNYQLISIPFDDYLSIPLDTCTFINKYLPYGSIDDNMNYIVEGVAVPWKVVWEKWGGLPENEAKFKLKALYSGDMVA